MIERGPGWEMRLGDCIEGMRQMADDSVDVSISDPPYSRDLYARTRTNKGTMRERDRLRPADMKAKLQLASNAIGCIDDILDETAHHLMRLTRRWIVVYHDVEIAERWRAAFGNWYVRSGAWVKPNPMPQISGDRPGQGFEMCTIAHRPGRKRWNGGGRAAAWISSAGEIEEALAWVFATCQGKERPDHPSPKPLGLMELNVADFSDLGELVFDCFSGSGTTGVACRNLNRRFLGFELNRDYFDIACRRLRGDEAKPRKEQPGLFDWKETSHG